MESELQTERSMDLIRCPNCGTLGPRTKFCLNCGMEKIPEDSEAIQEGPVQVPDEAVEEVEVTVEEVEVTGEAVEGVEKQEVEVEDEVSYDEPVEEEAFDLKYELDSRVEEIMMELKRSVDLIIWLVDLYQTRARRGQMEEEHFHQFLDAYEYRLDQCLKNRSLMLEISRDLKPIETALNLAKLNLSEFERKMMIGDISDEEYGLKVPVYKWDIEKLEAEMAKRSAEIRLLEDITQVMQEEEVAELKKMANNSQNAIEELKKSKDISPETATRIKEVFKKTLDVFQTPIKD